MAMHTAKVRRGSVVVSDDVAPGPTARDALNTVRSLLSGRPIALAFAPVEDRDGRVVARRISIGGASAAMFDHVFATAVRFGHGRDLAAAVLRQAAEAAAAAWRHAGPMHLRLPVEAIALDGTVSLVIQSLARAGADATELAIEIPLAACSADGCGGQVAKRLAEAGTTVILGDWDMSVAGLRAAAEGVFALVSLDAADPEPFCGAAGEVWSSAFRSLAGARVAVCARNVGGSRGALGALGVDLFAGPLAQQSSPPHPFPHFA